MEEFVQFGTRDYWIMFAVLLLSRGMDALSTWVATPNLVLEGNPLARLLGWRWGLPVNFGCCVVLAFWPLPAVILSTTSLLVAARNFQSAWLMRSMGEENYRNWHVQRIQETPVMLFLLCLAGNTFLTAGVGGAVIFFSNRQLLPFGIGVGIVAYGGAVAFYTLLAVWRLRRNEIRHAQLMARFRGTEPRPEPQPRLEQVLCAEELQGK
jgi:hypothetical protein